MRTLSGPRLCKLAWRVAAYPGVMYARIRAEADNNSSAPVAGRQLRSDVEHVDATKQAVESHPLLNSFIDIA